MNNFNKIVGTAVPLAASTGRMAFYGGWRDADAASGVRTFPNAWMVRIYPYGVGATACLAPRPQGKSGWRDADAASGTAVPIKN